ncbi:response regulator [Paludibaculum fermentans]|uniref:Response regulator transcription factor n=1 Tax=Paludibaculum fermentans TaxID=1473598 RepID=A0A7S7NX28_PALFE|nr:response regulator transcription factor [Paludibaculum fermentans]QOY91347.1 response regulator transcription factor [Paludibaculum fermentans]
MSKIRIILADDHTVIRSGLKLLLERQPDLEVVGEAENGRQAVDLAEQLVPDVAVLDIAMPQLNGIDASRQIVARNPKVAVVILSMHSDEGYVMRALQVGAKAYLLKDSAEVDLIRAVRSVHAGESFFSPSVGRVLLEDYVRQMRVKGTDDSYELLTNREREVLQLIAEGKANKEISSLLNLSLHTVETHRTRILQKLNLHSVPELILYAVRKGIVT